MKNNAITSFFIERPIFSTVLSLIAVLAGIFSLGSLPIAQYPDITPPTVMVSASYPGAEPSLIATTVGAPIEEAINGVEDMIYMSSTSSEGSYSLTVTFKVGTDIDIASINVQNKLNSTINTLPSQVIQQGVTVTKAASNVLLILNLVSTDSIYNSLYLSNYSELNLVNDLARVDGVGQVMSFGAGNYSIRVWMDPEVLRIRKISASDIYQAISEQNLNATAGAIGQPPVSNKIMFQYTLSTGGLLTDVEGFKNIIVQSTETGELLRLGDVATVELGSQSYAQTATYMGDNTSLIAISQLPGANAIKVADASLEKMKELAKYLPENVTYSVTLNTTTFITDSIKEVIKTFFETLFLVILVILFFLQNWRAVIIPSITIPVSLIATFAVMLMLGFTINLLTLFGLILSIAIVVDDAIVVVENSYRLMEKEGKDVKSAVEQAISELIGPIIAIDLSMLAVFIPTSFISGITGELIKQFALTIAASTIISGFVSITLTPALCALFLKLEPPSKFILFKLFNKFFDKVKIFYDKTMTFLLEHVWVAFAIFIVVCGLGLIKFMKLPTTFIPTEDQGYCMVVVQLPNAATLDRTEEVLNSIADLYLKDNPIVESYAVISGYSMMSGSGGNEGTIWIILKNWSERKKKGESAMDLVSKINQQAYFAIPEAVVYAMNPPAIPGLGSSSGLTLELQDINNYGYFQLYDAYEELVKNIDKAPSLENINSFYNPNVPQYYINIDREKVRMLGLTFSQVAKTLSYYLGSAYVNDFIDFGRVYQVIMAGSDMSRSTIEDVKRISIANKNGEMVPLSSVISFEYQMAPSIIDRYNLYTSAQLNIDIKPGSSSGTAIKQTQDLVYNTLGKNFGYSWTDTAYQEIQSGSSMTTVLILAFFMIILVLAAQYESWTNPFAVILSVGFAIVGITIGCLVWKLPISIYSQIGMILLIALSAKNAILIIAFARDNRFTGMSIREAALQAGNVRLRPILMTSLAFVFGVAPLMFATGAGAASRVSLGVAVVFGMAVNGIFGTLFIPNFFELMQKIEENFLQKPKWDRLKKGFENKNNSTEEKNEI